MDAARITSLLEPFLDCPLTPLQLDQTSMYIDLLLRWNARINLTAIRDPDQIVIRHFGESFFLARHLFPVPDPLPTDHRPLTTVLDLGSGAGFPGLPLKIWAPHIRLTLVESNHKKAAFLREVARSLTLTDVNVIAERAETLAARLNVAPRSASRTNKASFTPPAPTTGAGPPGAFATPGPTTEAHTAAVSTKAVPPSVLADVVTFRAVEKFERTLPLAARFLAIDGRIAILLSKAQLSALESIPSLAWHTVNVPRSHSSLLAIGGMQSDNIDAVYHASGN